MIYFNVNRKHVLRLIQDEVTRAKCMLYTEIDREFRNNQEFEDFLSKWTERYQLNLTPKQRFYQKKKGNPTFDLIITIPDYTFSNPFIRDCIEIAKEDKEEFMNADFLALTHHYLPIRFYLFCNIDSPKVYNQELSLSEINAALKEQISGVEEFSYVTESKYGTPIQFLHYELVRLTKKRTVRDVLEGNSPHATDWTWRLTQEAFSELQSVGLTLINSFQNKIGGSETDRSKHFSKHKEVMQNYYGFRGVRQQIGKLWATERKIFIKKYGNKYSECYEKLQLNYMQRLKSLNKSNITAEEMLDMIKKAICSAAAK